MPPLITMEVLSVLSTNVLSLLSYVPDNNIMVLFVNGQAISPVGPQASFSVTNNTIQWRENAPYSVPLGSAVIAVYTHI